MQGFARGAAIVSESGLYALILGSRMPKAKAFRRWVTGVVLPAIRKDGAYIKGEEKVVTGEMSKVPKVDRRVSLPGRPSVPRSRVEVFKRAQVRALVQHPEVHHCDRHGTRVGTHREAHRRPRLGCPYPALVASRSAFLRAQSRSFRAASTMEFRAARRASRSTSFTGSLAARTACRVASLRACSRRQC